MKKNDVIELIIEDMGTEGEGIGHISDETSQRGIAVFVKDAVMGDHIEAVVTKVKKQYAYAKVLKILEPSPDRVEPRCPVARPCGGCTLQHIRYEKQLEYKWNKVCNCLSRIGGLERPEERMEPPIGMEDPWHYRNKAQFPVGRDKDGRVIAGFYAGRSHTIIDTPHCYIQAEGNDDIIRRVREFLQMYQISIYDEEQHRGLVRHILTRVGFATGEIMVCLVINGKKLPHAEALIEMLKQVPGMTSISINMNPERTNRILGDTCVTLWGQDYITDYIGEIKYQISPLSFYQVNPEQTRKLYEKALEYADLQGGETVWDLYCGIGTISLFLSQKAKQVYGVEIVPQAIEDARRNAVLNDIQNAEFFVGKAEEVLPQQYRENAIYADVIIVDPPRKGCEEVVLETIAQMHPKRVVYVSCDPATLARDVKRMDELGYRVEKVAVVDQFCQSGHVETVCLLGRLHEAKHHVNVRLDMDELDITSAESKAAYAEIKDYVLKEHGLKVSNLYISQVKRKCGIEVGENYNLPKSADSRQPQCPEEKEKAIKDALEHFGMV